jgi:hypothetical protein
MALAAPHGGLLYCIAHTANLVTDLRASVPHVGCVVARKATHHFSVRSVLPVHDGMGWNRVRIQLVSYNSQPVDGTIHRQQYRSRRRASNPPASRSSQNAGRSNGVKSNTVADRVQVGYRETRAGMLSRVGTACLSPQPNAC